MPSLMSRIFFIDTQLRTRGKITLKDIMRHGEVGSATAKRDIEFLRHTLDAPLVYDRKLRAYVYEKEFTLLNFAGEQLFLFYVMAKGALNNPKYFPLTAEYARKIISEKIAEILPSDYKKIADKFYYYFSDYEKLDLEVLRKVIEAMRENKVCAIEYLSKGKTKSKREIEPLKAVCYGAKWYLLAYCRKRKALRIFSFSRIEKIKVLEVEFNPNAHSDVDKYLKEGFGIAKGDELKTAVIKFYEPASYYVKNQIWHEEQVIEFATKDGENILFAEIPYAKPEELIGKVLKYGASAEILKPASLRKMWIKEIEKMAELIAKANDKSEKKN